MQRPAAVLCCKKRCNVCGGASRRPKGAGEERRTHQERHRQAGHAGERGGRHAREAREPARQARGHPRQPRHPCHPRKARHSWETREARQAAAETQRQAGEPAAQGGRAGEACGGGRRRRGAGNDPLLLHVGKLAVGAEALAVEEVLADAVLLRKKGEGSKWSEGSDPAARAGGENHQGRTEPATAPVAGSATSGTWATGVALPPKNTGNGEPCGARRAGRRAAPVGTAQGLFRRGDDARGQCRQRLHPRFYDGAQGAAVVRCGGETGVMWREIGVPWAGRTWMGRPLSETWTW